MYKVKKRQSSVTKTLIIMFLFKLIIELSYIYAVSPLYSYMGFIYCPNIKKMFFSDFLFVIMFLLLPKKNIFSNIITEMFFVICIIPNISFFWLANKETKYILLIVLFFLILELSVKYLNVNLKHSYNSCNITSNRKNFIIIIFLVYILLCVYLGNIRGGIDLRTLSFDSIYLVRGEYSGSSLINNYLIGWCAKSLFPILTVYFLFQKKLANTLLCILLQLYLYLCYGYKAYLFSAGFVVLVYYLGSSGKNKCFINKFVLILTVFLIPNFFININGLIGKTSFKIMSTYCMRMLFEPARIEFGYFSFFSVYDKLYFSEGLIGKLFNLKYPYSKPIGFIITEYMLGPENISNQNTGVIADSFSQIGIIGIIGMPLLICVYFKLIDLLSKKIPTFLLVSIFSYPVFMLNDNPFFTNLLTNGLIIDLVILTIISHGFVNKNDYSIFRKDNVNEK